MTRWILLVLMGTGFHLSAGKLKGSVRTDEGRPVNRAKVFVLHQLSSVLVQQGTTDRNGSYLFTVHPGPYRVVVLKKGFQVDLQRILVLSEFDEAQLEHAMIAGEAVAKGKADKIKDLLRNGSRDPFRPELEYHVGKGFDYAPPRQQSFAGRVDNDTRQGLSGDLETTSSVRVSTKINNAVSLDSSVSSGKSDFEGLGAKQIKAGFRVDWQGGALGVAAESIQRTDTPGTESSRGLSLAGSYGDRMRSGTRVSLVESRSNGDQQKRLSFSHDLRYQVGAHQFTHGAGLTNWDKDGIGNLRKAAVSSNWTYGRQMPIGIGTKMDILDLPSERVTNARLWVQGDTEQLNRRWSLSSRVGVSQFDDDDSLIQRHNLTANMGKLRMQADFQDENQVQAYAAADLYGGYMVQPVTPYNNQGFFHRKSREIGMQSYLEHGRGYGSKVFFKRNDEEGSLLYALGQAQVRNQSVMQSRHFGYSFHSDRIGARVQLTHGFYESDTYDFKGSEILYGQELSPFRNRGMLFELELRMKNNPTLPAWWLLEASPWEPGDNGMFYEGRLSLQF